jgi:hypothetical protein
LSRAAKQSGFASGIGRNALPLKTGASAFDFRLIRYYTITHQAVR